MVYLDNNATTPIDPAVVAEMLPYLTEFYGNPSSAYSFGSRVAKALLTARQRVAALLGCEPEEIVFTSCGTESNNSALNSALAMDPGRRHVITTGVEHSAILKHCEALAKKGIEITLLGVDARGRLDLAELENAIRPDTALVSVMWANNETGVLNPIPEIAAICHSKKTLFHTDAVQAVGKIPVRLEEVAVNFLSLSGHKLHAPKGVGVLYVNRRTKFHPFLIGGGQENHRRAGTENVAGIVALGKACELAGEFLSCENGQVRALRDAFERGVLERIPAAMINGDREFRLPNTTSIALEGVDAEALVLMLDRHRICCSVGSACASGSLAASHVLKAMGLSTERARGSLRFSLSRFNSKAEVDRALEVLTEAVGRLRA